MRRIAAEQQSFSFYAPVPAPAPVVNECFTDQSWCVPYRELAADPQPGDCITFAGQDGAPQRATVIERRGAVLVVKRMVGRREIAWRFDDTWPRTLEVRGD